MCLGSQGCSSKVPFQVLLTTPNILTSRLSPWIQYFQGKLLWELERVCSFNASPQPASYIDTGSRRPALATAGSFKEQHEGSLETIHLPSHTGRPSRACHSHCQTAQINISPIIFFRSSFLFAPRPPFRLPSAISKELILDEGEKFLYQKEFPQIQSLNKSQKFSFTNLIWNTCYGLSTRVRFEDVKETLNVEKHEGLGFVKTFVNKNSFLKKQLGVTLDLLCSCYCTLRFMFSCLIHLTRCILSKLFY